MLKVTEKKPVTTESPLELKVKAVTLAAEARIIRNLEKRLKRRKKDGTGGMHNPLTFAQYNSLHRHRLDVVRPEVRATNLARAFLKGKKYRWVEEKTHECSDPTKSIAAIFDGRTVLHRAMEIAIGFSALDPRVIKQRFAEWEAEAKEHLVALRAMEGLERLKAKEAKKFHLPPF